MTIVVTGAPGWLGSEIVNRLHDRDESIRCLVYYGVDTDALDAYDVDIVRGDITDPDSLSNLFDDSVEYVYHCAGVNHPAYWHGVSQIHAINAGGTRNLVEAARDHDLDRFVYVSSIMAHGFNDPPNRDWTPAMEARPDTEYGRSKLKAEQHVRATARDDALDYTIVRPCWYYGPRQPPRMATLMESIQSGRPLMFGDGTNRRSMMYVPSLVDLLMAIRDKPTASRNEVYDVADQQPYTTNEIYDVIGECLEVDPVTPRHLYEPIPSMVGFLQRLAERMDVHVREFHVGWEMAQPISCDPSKAMDDLDWEPPSQLQPGMQTAVDWAIDNGQLD